MVVLGVGDAGAQIACDFALGGCSVVWFDELQQAAAERLEQTLRMVGRQGLAGPAELERARAMLTPQARGWEGAGSGGRVTLVLEALPEEAGLKADSLYHLARLHPEALVATTSTTVGVTSLGEAAGAAERMLCLGYGPAPLLTPTVELIAAATTPPRLVQRVSQLLRAIGKRPVVLAREAPGLVGERLRLALLRESLSLVARGVATPEQVDEIVRELLARGWRHGGPFAEAALEQTGTIEAAAAAVLPTLAAEQGAEGLAAVLAGGDPQLVRERRDDALAEELRAERAASAGGAPG
ncbi:MAG: 3-hydroxyacyl-CoA dehydrogenase NAD-binding domain-containing protein [Solirubrobacteraceae bacterium]